LKADAALIEGLFTIVKLGPTLPEFVSPGVLKVLVDTFAIAPITTAEADMAACLS